MTQISKEESRKNQILDAALEVVVEKGYADCRMDDIVETSGLSKGTIYWYYKSKKEVFLSLINHWVNKFGVTLNHIVEEDLSASDQLHELFAFFLDIYENHSLLALLLQGLPSMLLTAPKIGHSYHWKDGHRIQL